MRVSGTFSRVPVDFVFSNVIADITIFGRSFDSDSVPSISSLALGSFDSVHRCSLSAQHSLETRIRTSVLQTDYISF